MYNQFIIFIIVLFLCALYQPRTTQYMIRTGNAVWFAAFLAMFVITNRLSFQRIENRIRSVAYARRDQDFENAVMRQTVLAILLFIVTLYQLHIPDFLLRFSLFTLVPTLSVVLCLGFFILFLVLIYHEAHGAYQQIYHQQIARKPYIRSSLSFGVPVIVPWVVLSIITDILLLLPFRPLKTFMNSALGEITFFLVFILVIAGIGPFFIQKLWRCKPLEPGYRRDRIRRLCKAAAMGYRDIVYWPLFGGRLVTAGVMGLFRQFRYVLVTPALMQMLDDDEIDAVMAHEIGHVKQKHMLFYIVFLAGFFLLFYLLLNGLSIITAYVYLSSGMDGVMFSHPASAEPSSAAPFLFILIFITCFILYFRFVFGFFMRNFERQADAYVYTFFISAAGLMSSLEKIALSSGTTRDKPNWHHFSIKERIDFLRRCEEDRGCIVRHNKKMKTAVISFMAAFMLLGAGSLVMYGSRAGAFLTNRLAKTILYNRIEKSPNDPRLYGLLGDIHQFEGDFGDAAVSYEKSLALDPDDPEVLNNFAWLLATCEDPVSSNPEKAARLAERAADLFPSPHILDTLAESYFASGRPDKAVEIIRKAIDAAEGDKGYYIDQLERFQGSAAD